MRSMELFKSKKNVNHLLEYDQKRSIVFNLVYFVLGIFISKTSIFLEYSPFGASLISAVPYKNLLITLLGTFFGYILPSSVNMKVRYIIVVISIALVRWSLNDLKKLNSSKLYAPLISVITIFSTGLVLNMGDTFLKNIFSYNMLEAIFSGIFAYFFKETALIFKGKNFYKHLTQKELVCVFISFWVIVVSLSNVYIWKFSLGRIFSIFLILFCSRFLGVLGGSVAGISAALAIYFSYKSSFYLGGVYSFSGMIAGFISNLGKYAQVAAFFIISILMSLFYENNNLIVEMYEVIIAATIFIFIPDNVGKFLTNMFYYPTNDYKFNVIQEDIVNKLNFTSNAIFNIGNSINKVSNKLSKVESGGSDKISKEIKENICRLCGLKTFCWETRIKETLQAFDNINTVFLNDLKLEKENVPKLLASRCCRIEDIINIVKSFYRENQIRKISQKRIKEVKSFVYEQFSDMSRILKDLSDNYKNGIRFDLEMAKKVNLELKRLGIMSEEVICRYDNFNRFFLDLELLCRDEKFLKSLNLNKILSKVCKKRLDIPCITTVKDKTRISITESSNFSVDVGAFQHVCKDEILSGDNYTYFNDGRGRMIFILSDGMGTGARAAIEGAMACEIMSNLLKSEISFETAVKVTNSCLFVKSEDEIFSTLDIVCFDLFTGAVKFIKCGAPISLFRKNDEIFDVDLPSLPVGILKNVSYVFKNDVLSFDDRILILSDGAIYPDEVWLRSEIKEWKDEAPSDFARRIVEKAVENRKDFYDDDITAIAIKFNKI